MQTSHSKRKYKKVGWSREFLINTLYGFGMKGKRISRIVGVSPATVYRHIKR
jgi:transposase